MKDENWNNQKESKLNTYWGLGHKVDLQGQGLQARMVVVRQMGVGHSEELSKEPLEQVWDLKIANELLPKFPRNTNIVQRQRWFQTL